jgi:hypothetical protein
MPPFQGGLESEYRAFCSAFIGGWLFHAVHQRGLDMTPAEEQQMLKSLSDISQDIKALLTLIKDLTRQQSEADQKAYGQLVNIAHKR